MKVSGNKPPQKQTSSVKAQKTEKTEQLLGHGAVQKIGSADKVDLSGKAKGMAGMTSVINLMPEIRTEKVQEIGKAVNDGTYVVDPEKVAEKMIEEMP